MASQNLALSVCASIIYAPYPMSLANTRIQHPNHDTRPQQNKPRPAPTIPRPRAPPRKQAMPPLRSNEQRKTRKPNRPRPRLCDRRLAKMQDAKKPSTYKLLTAKPPLSTRNPDLALKISQMRLTIAPIVHVETGTPAPDYPHTMLSLFTLTEPQLDALAAYYSQSHTPTALTHQYPTTMDWGKPVLDTDPALPAGCRLSDMERLKIKMRMFARFIGMRGADTPAWECERAVEILRNKIGRVVRQEEEEVVRNKGYRGLTRYQ